MGAVGSMYYYLSPLRSSVNQDIEFSPQAVSNNVNSNKMYHNKTLKYKRTHDDDNNFIKVVKEGNKNRNSAECSESKKFKLDMNGQKIDKRTKNPEARLKKKLHKKQEKAKAEIFFIEKNQPIILKNFSDELKNNHVKENGKNSTAPTERKYYAK